MKILYAGPMESGSSCHYRLMALERLGHEVVPFRTDVYEYKNRLLHALTFRASMGPNIVRLNRDLLALAKRIRPDVFWVDKGLSITPSTVDKIKRLGARTVSYMIDNAFGPRQDPGWRLYMKSIRRFDLHVTQRDVSVRDYLARGAGSVLKIQTAFEPTVHFPPPQPLTDADRPRAVSFIGTPYDDRAEIITQLSRMGLPLAINGPLRAWKSRLAPDVFARVYRGGELWQDAYREGIWHSRINLSFITRSNEDEYTHKSFEIAACEGFLLCERSEGHALRFVEDREAVFFNGIEELASKVTRYLPDQAGRTAIARAGRIRAVRDGYDNDSQVRRILEVVEALPPSR